MRYLAVYRFIVEHSWEAARLANSILQIRKVAKLESI